MSELFKLIEDYSQKHLLQDLAELKSQQEEQNYLQKLTSIDYSLINRLYVEKVLSDTQETASFSDIRPVPNVKTLKDLEYERTELHEIGLRTIAEGKVAVLLMSGGQGSRLGFNEAKGKYSIGLPSGDTIFQLFAGKFHALRQLL